jgi:hypothetical protein
VYTTTKRAEFELEKLQTRQCNVIIHYDGHIQKELEQVVQKIYLGIYAGRFETSVPELEGPNKAETG